MELIKKTKSLSPLTFKEIDATIIEESDSVFMIKKDESGKEYKALIENNVELYKELSGSVPSAPKEPKTIHVNSSSVCNLNCNMCYAAFFDDKGFIDKIQLEKILAPYEGKNVILSGKEPTMNEDLHKLIPIINKKNRSVILTNGIKLADFDYIKKLRDAGEFTVSFSLNGITDSTLNTIDAAPLRDKKLKALENLKKLNIPTVISTTILKGINEDELNHIYKYCLDNLSWIASMRIRSAVSTGKHIDVEQYTLSDLLKLYSKISMHELESIHNSARFIRHISQQDSYYVKKTCAYQFLIRKENPRVLVGGNLDIRQMNNKDQVNLFERLKKGRNNDAALFSENYFQIDVRSWPNIYNIDLEEMKKCHSSCHYDLNSPDKGIPFCVNNAMCSHGNS